jgi:hypothetical protein
VQQLLLMDPLTCASAKAFAPPEQTSEGLGTSPPAPGSGVTFAPKEQKPLCGAQTCAWVDMMTDRLARLEMDNDALRSRVDELQRTRAELVQRCRVTWHRGDASDIMMQMARPAIRASGETLGWTFDDDGQTSDGYIWSHFVRPCTDIDDARRHMTELARAAHALCSDDARVHNGPVRFTHATTTFMWSCDAWVRCGRGIYLEAPHAGSAMHVYAYQVENTAP